MKNRNKENKTGDESESDSSSHSPVLVRSRSGSSITTQLAHVDTRPHGDQDYYRDISMKWLFTPRYMTMMILSIGLLLWAANLTMSSLDVCLPSEVYEKSEEDFYSARVGLVASIVAVILFAVTAAPDGVFLRPHPLVWRIVLGCSMAYLLFLVQLLTMTVDAGRQHMKLLDSSLGIYEDDPPYAEDCRIYTPELDNKFHNVYMCMIDPYSMAHFIGWAVKALIIRDARILWLSSALWEWTEISFTPLLPNFAECWWDQWIWDFALCNGLGIIIGMKLARSLKLRRMHWLEWNLIRTKRGKIKRAAQQLLPFSYDTFEGVEITASPMTFLLTGLGAYLWMSYELNAFLLKTVLWIPRDSNLNLARLFLVAFMAAPTSVEINQYISNPEVNRLGAQAIVSFIIVFAETMVAIKYGLDTFMDHDPHNPIVVAINTVGGIVFAGSAIIYFLFFWKKPEQGQEPMLQNPLYSPSRRAIRDGRKEKVN